MMWTRSAAFVGTQQIPYFIDAVHAQEYLCEQSSPWALPCSIPYWKQDQTASRLTDAFTLLMYARHHHRLQPDVNLSTFKQEMSSAQTMERSTVMDRVSIVRIQSWQGQAFPSCRACFSIVQLDSENQIAKAIYGCLPDNMPQTSLAAECAAFFAFISYAPRGTYVGDCEEVLSRFNSPLADALASDNAHACTWKACLMKGGHAFKRHKGVVKVKAHRSIDSAQGQADIRRLMGNDAADSLAKRGALLHPQ